MEEVSSNDPRFKLAIETHKHFFDTMYKNFGLLTLPKYASVKMVPMWSMEGISLNPDTLIINSEIDDLMEIQRCSAHGSSHLLDPFIRKSQGVGIEVPNKDRLLHEIVADLGGLVYFEILYGKEGIKKYFGNGRPDYKLVLAKQIFEGDKSLLVKLCSLDMDHARELILPYLSEGIEVHRDSYSLA